MWLRRTALAFGALAGLALAARSARATPQLHGAATTGIALTDLRTNGPRVAAHLGGRFDVLFLREGPRDMGVGPYVDVATAAFDTFEAGGGLSWLLPAGETAFVLSGGAFARTSAFGWEPGAAATIFWGSKSFNYHSAYNLTVGLFAQGRYGFGDGHQADAIAGVEVDLEYLALPFLLAYEAIRR
jgi:hypothetical protein